MYILVCSISQDIHALKVIRLLKSRNVNVVFLKTDKYSTNNGILFNSSAKSPFFIIVSNKKYTLDQFSSLWIRKPYFRLETKGANPKLKAFQDFKFDEMKRLTNSLFSVSEQMKIFTVNEKTKSYLASDKLDQLMAAKRLGMQIPDTIVSSDKKELIRFMEAHSNICIIKNLVIHPQMNVVNAQWKELTYELTTEFFSEYYSKRKLDYPILIQEKILKDHELRITVVGKKIFACSIDSQQNPNAKIDWRSVSSESLKHSMVQLPPQIEKFCFDICRTFKLQYGAIDMAVTPDGNYVFFEINSAGQYLWIEELTKAPISEAMAELLMDHENYKLV